MKRQDIDWEKIFANHIFHKGLISKLYKELSEHVDLEKTSNAI